jgi:hypothetical protein
MAKSAKLIGGTQLSSPTPSVALHATPTSPALSSMVKSPVTKNSPLPSQSALHTPVPSLKVPTIMMKMPNVITDIDSSNKEVTSPANSSVKVYTQHTGLPETEPTIVLSSEFVPLFEGGQLNKTGKALSLKSSSKILTAKTAISTLLQSEDTKDAITANKTVLKDFINQETSLVKSLMSELAKAYASLDVATKKIQNSASQPVSSLADVLHQGGYSSKNIEQFTNTKLWQQSLVELKRTLLSHSPGITGQSFSRKDVKNDNDPFLLSDIEEPPTGMQRIWINPYYTKLPKIEQLYEVKSIQDNLVKLIDFKSSQYTNLIHANPPPKLVRSSNTAVKKTVAPAAPSRLGKGGTPLIISSDVLTQYESTGRDITIIANALFKEAFYSLYMLNKTNASMLSTKYGYTIDKAGDNFPVWDYIVGRFPDSVLDIVKSPTGNGRSLVSLSQVYIPSGQDSYNVLTFERNYLEGTNITPGSYYYIDSSLSTTDGKKLDTSRLGSLTTSLLDAHLATKTILDMSGYDIVSLGPGFGEVYSKKTSTYEYNLGTLSHRLSMVTDVYRKCMINDSKKSQIESLDPEILRRHLTLEESTGTRLASVICKCAIDPVQSYKKSSNRLKPLLFLWLMNVVLQQSDGVSNSSTITELKKYISQELSTNVINVENSNTLYVATEQGRTFPFTLGNAPDLNKPPYDNKSGKFDVYEEIGVDTPDEANEIVANERKQALLLYQISIGSRVFEIDSDKGLWKVMSDTLRDVYESNIYENDNTGYSGMSKVAYLYSYFDLMLRIIASQCPENLIGTYNSTYYYSAPLVLKGDIRPDIAITESGLMVDAPTPTELNQRFNATYIIDGLESSSCVKKLFSAQNYLLSEDNVLASKVGLFRKMINEMSTNLTRFNNFLGSNFSSYLTNVRNLYLTDPSLNETQRDALINLSLSEEQMKLNRFIMSEFSDRISEGDGSAKLKSTNWFKSFPDGFEEFLSVDEMEHISFPMLSPYFKSVEFLKEKGNNKKILSIGIPPKLNRYIHSSAYLPTDNVNSIKQGIVNVKVYKLDRLHPDIVYHPKSFLFETNRFPTRILNNWNYTAFASNETNILTMPSKLVGPDNEVYVYKNFSDAFPDKFYGGLLTEDEEFEIYSNHSISFLLEEYLRWFTDCNFDEARYYNFTPLSPELANMQQQFNQYIRHVKKQSVLPGQTLPPGQVVTQHSDPVSGQTFSVPAKSPNPIPLNPKFAVFNPKAVFKGKLNLKGVKVPPATSPPKKTSFMVPMDETIKSFFMSETFFSSPDEYKKKMVYPKKFDRVFNVVIDPDDFYVDESMSDPHTLDQLVSIGALVGGDQGVSKPVKEFKHRDTSSADISFDEYFVTVEPYDYVGESEK